MRGPRLRVAVIAPLRYAIAEPHAGGLESSVWNQVRMLRRNGHQVTLAAVRGSDFTENAPQSFALPEVVWSDPSLANDVDYPAGYLAGGLRALDGALSHIQQNAGDFDIVHNHNLHGLPLAFAGDLGVPMLTTLHTPVLPDMVAGNAATTGIQSRFVAVSSHTAREWSKAGITSRVMPNAIDSEAWMLGPGGSDLVWFGRIVAEKAPHLAVLAARRAGLRIVLAGRIGDPGYAERELWPLLGPDAVYVGELNQQQLGRLVGHSAAALVTPMWQEPFGLVIAEALMTGTPVACFETGGASEVTRRMPGTRSVPMGDVDALAAAAIDLVRRSREPKLRVRARSAALRRFALTARTLELEQLYRTMIAEFETVRGSSRAVGATRSSGRHGVSGAVPSAL